MEAPGLIETQRLYLRKPLLSDAEAIYKGYARDRDVVRYLIWLPHQSIEETSDFLGTCIQAWQGGSTFPYVIERKDDHQLLGMIEARIDRHTADIGYVLAKAFWGQGYMPEALKPVTELILAQPEVYRIGVLCDVDNVASARVMEKVGMQREGLLRRRLIHPNVSAEPRDAYLYSIIK